MPIGRPRFVTTEEALGWHAVLIAEYGGSEGLRDAGLLDSALAAPRQSFAGEFAHDYPFAMAAAYAFHLAKNHPFVDGNKRVALMCCGAFLQMNGWDLVSEGEAAADAILDLVSGGLDKDGFADWLRANCREKPRLELRDFFALLRPEDLKQADRGLDVSAPVERDATFQETADAIPVAWLLLAYRDAAEATGLKEHALVFQGQVQLLMTLYRLAEDMGYEW
jgi:death-on-curing protein